MKTLKQTTYVFAIALALIFTGCSKDDDGGGGGDAASGTIKAKVDGANFTSNSDFTTANTVNAGGTTTMTIQGTDNSGKGFMFIINGMDGTGTYEIGSGVGGISIIASYVEANASNPIDSQTWQAPFDDTVAGQIQISELSDTNVKGTFEFTCKNSNDDSMKEITDGSFNVEVNSH